jgi:chemotaxis protein CheD
MDATQSGICALPAATRGYEHINRYWDRQMQVPAAKLMPGEVYVSYQGEMIVTVLGSCVAACIRDRVRGIGGMNHFMLPEQTEYSSGFGGDATRVENRYGNWAMEFLINEILKLGCDKRNLEIKIFGGGRVLDAVSDIGQRNIAFVKDFLRKESLQIAAEDVGSIYPRKVLYFSDTGAVKVRKLKTLRNETIVQREASYRRSVNAEQQRCGDIELF